MQPEPAQLPLVSLIPPTPPPGAPIVECVFVRRRGVDVRVRAVSGTDSEGQPIVEGTWCRFPPDKRHAGARFAVTALTRVTRVHRFYYVASRPFWLLAPGGTP